MITITAIVFIFRNQILIALGASNEILPYAKNYLGLVIFGNTFLSLTIFISHIMISLGNNKVAIISNSIGAMTNIIVDYILVVHKNMGVKGAAIARTVSQIAGFIFAYYMYSRVKKKYGIDSGFKINRNIIMPIVLVGLSTFIVEAEDGIVMAVLNNLLVRTVWDSGIVVLGIIRG